MPSLVLISLNFFNRGILSNILSFNNISFEQLTNIWPKMKSINNECREQIEIESSYAGYLKRQNEDVANIKNPFVSFLNNHFDSTIYQISLPKNWDEYTNRILKKSVLTQNLRKEKLNFLN